MGIMDFDQDFIDRHKKELYDEETKILRGRGIDPGKMKIRVTFDPLLKSFKTNVDRLKYDIAPVDYNDDFEEILTYSLNDQLQEFKKLRTRLQNEVDKINEYIIKNEMNDDNISQVALSLKSVGNNKDKAQDDNRHMIKLIEIIISKTDRYITGLESINKPNNDNSLPVNKDPAADHNKKEIDVAIIDKLRASIIKTNKMFENNYKNKYHEAIQEDILCAYQGLGTLVKALKDKMQTTDNEKIILNKWPIKASKIDIIKKLYTEIEKELNSKWSKSGFISKMEKDLPIWKEKKRKNKIRN